MKRLKRWTRLIIVGSCIGFAVWFVHDWLAWQSGAGQPVRSAFAPAGEWQGREAGYPPVYTAPPDRRQLAETEAGARSARAGFAAASVSSGGDHPAAAAQTGVAEPSGTVSADTRIGGLTRKTGELIQGAVKFAGKAAASLFDLLLS